MECFLSMEDQRGASFSEHSPLLMQSVLPFTQIFGGTSQTVIKNARKEVAQSLEDILFNSIINNLKERSVKKAASFTGDAKLGGVANVSENGANTEEWQQVTNTERK